MAVAEALAAGLPVITTRATPWALLESERCGWWVPVSIDGIARALADATALGPDRLRDMGERGRRAVATRFAWPSVARQFIQVYGWLNGKEPRPACVSGRSPV
jgi:glycosyltransferase involved in cell wall biosynthesis